ncbi:MAG: hypothetical protein BRD57_05885 [Proteobacteria bacterium SW_6_67_9]|nr:MAG: hypothetical protein BRD57_05885 [Proteobacteria bacterium SW_6_67_9]
MTANQAVRNDKAPPPSSAAPAFRATSWLILGGLLRHTPDQALLARSAGWATTVDDGGTGPLGAAWSALASAIAEVDLSCLDDEYHDLFIGLGRGELVPYASWYRTGFLMDRPLVALRRDLALLGFERPERVSEPEDHAAAIAETMGLLADPDEGQDDSTQRLFFSEHIDSWMPDFFADLRNAKSADFYTHVGRLGAAFVEFERGWLAAESPSPRRAQTSGVAKP